MADTQNIIYAEAYSQNIMQLAQQKFSKLINTVYMKPNVRGKTFFQDQIGKWSMEVKDLDRYFVCYVTNLDQGIHCC